MSRKGCIVTVIAVLLVLIGVGKVLYYKAEDLENPHYRGKRVYAWADQAMQDANPAAREEAAQALVEVFKEMKGWPRVHLSMRFCGPVRDYRGRPEVPKELILFLIETLHAEEMPAGSYQSMALSRVEDQAAVPALIEVILHDDDQHARDGAVAAIRMMYSEAGPALQALRRAMKDEDKEVQHRAVFV